MIRTAFSPIFNEGLDFSCVLFDRRGNMIGQAEFCPAQIAASLFIVRWTLEELGVDSFEPGDVVLHNDPYRGGAHIPEHSVMRPVFHEGELFGFVANVGHLAEIGGKAVGSFAADATEVFQEGLRIPPVKIVKRDENDMELWRLIMANHRTPRNTWGDLNAQIGSLRVAERRVIELLDRLRTRLRRAGGGRADGLLRALDARRDRRAFPTASTSSRERMEDDGVVAEPVSFHVTVTVDGDELVVDWTGTDPQVRGPINATYGVTAGATYNAVFHLTDMNIPKNSGAYRPIRIIAPPGSAVNVVLPGPVGRRQHRDAPEARGHGRRRARAGAARPRRGRRGRHGLQLPLRRRPPEDGRLLRQLPPRGRRLGREVLRRRQRRDHRQERQLPEHARGDLRDALPAARSRVLADRRLRRARADARRASARAASCASRRAPR